MEGLNIVSAEIVMIILRPEFCSLVLVFRGYPEQGRLFAA